MDAARRLKVPPPESPPPSGMWSTIAAVLTSGNALFILGTIVVVAILFGVFAKLGIISIHRKGMHIGAGSALAERAVLKRQVEYVQKYCLALEPSIEELFRKKEFGNEGARIFYFKYLAMLISNEAEKCVLINSIRDTPEYINLKCFEFESFIGAQVGNCEYDHELLRTRVRQHVETMVKHLILLRDSNGMFV